MKNLIFINGTMGAGKTAVCGALQTLLPACVFLDGDWCWNMRPFVVTGETRRMVIENIRFLLGQFLRCSAYQNILFCWVMHQREIADAVLSRLDLTGVDFHFFTLTLPEPELRARLARDVAAGLREREIIERSCARLPLYAEMDTVKIDVGSRTPRQAAAEIAERVSRAV